MEITNLIKSRKKFPGMTRAEIYLCSGVSKAATQRKINKLLRAGIITKKKTQRVAYFLKK